MRSFFPYLLVMAGSGAGGAARYACAGLISRLMGGTFPWGTLAVNVTGSVLIGVFAALTGPEGRLLAPPAVRQFVMPGICGGFTTFSTFSLETLNLARDGEWSRAAANVFASLLLCLAGVWAGYAAGALLNER
jgi:CrcB protein